MNFLAAQMDFLALQMDFLASVHPNFLVAGHRNFLAVSKAEAPDPRHSRRRPRFGPPLRRRTNEPMIYRRVRALISDACGVVPWAG